MMGDPAIPPSSGPAVGKDNSTRLTLDVQAGTHNTVNDRIAISVPSFEASRLQEAYEQKIVDDLTAGTISIGDVNTVIQSITVSTVDASRKAIYAADFMLEYSNKARAEVGATQNRLESALNNIETYTENLSGAESRILDADFAYQTAKMSKFQVMQQAGVAILEQANGLSQSALRLI